MAGVKIVDLPSLGRDLISTDLLELSLVGGSGSRKITGQEIMNASKLNVGATPIINGTAGRILFQGAGDVLGESANLFWDNTNARLGVGIAVPTSKLHVKFNGALTSGIDIDSTAFNTNHLSFSKDGVMRGQIGMNDSSGEIRYFCGAGGYYPTFWSNNNERMRIHASTGNVSINTASDAGYKLDVNGTARLNASSGNDIITDATNVTVNGYASGSSLIRFQSRNAAAALVYKFVVPNNNDTAGYFTGNVGIGTSSPTAKIDILQVADNTSPTLLRLNNTGSGASTGATLEFPFGAFIRSSYASMILSDRSGATLTLQGTTLSSSASSFNLAGAGIITFTGGSGTDGMIRTGGTITFNTFSSGYRDVGKFFQTGNLLIQTGGTFTDAGYKLDVNGTARVNNQLWITNSAYTGGLRFESIGNNQQRIVGGNSENITFGAAGNTINLTASEVYVSTSLLGPKFWIQANGSTLIGAQTYAAASALFELRTTTQGFLPPRMTNAQRAAIASPAVGLIVYCTDSTEGLYVYKSTGWTFMV